MRSREPTEAQIQSAVIAHWRACGVDGSLIAAIPNAYAHGQPGLTKGLPDLLVIGLRFIGFIELKTMRGRLSQDQADVMATIRGNGIPCAVTYGRDEPIQVLKEWGIVR